MRVRIAASICLTSFLVAAASTACDGGGATASIRDIVVVEVDPPTGAVRVGESRSFVAVGKDDAGRVVPVPDVDWTISDPAVARVDERGVVTGESIGKATVSARANGVAGNALITVLERAESDRPDDRSGPQIHLVYVIPSDGEDHSLDLEGGLLNMVGAVQTWLAAQTGGRTLRIDTYQGVLDDSFLRLDRTAAEMLQADAGVLQEALLAAGFDDPQKIYVAYYDGPDMLPGCDRRLDSSLPLMTLYLLDGCRLNFVDVPTAEMGEAELRFVRNILHLIGFVDAGAPNHLDNHVDDDPRDILYIDHPHSPVLLDVGRDDYYGENVPDGVLDFAESLYLD